MYKKTKSYSIFGLVITIGIISFLVYMGYQSYQVTEELYIENQWLTTYQPYESNEESNDSGSDYIHIYNYTDVDGNPIELLFDLMNDRYCFRYNNTLIPLETKVLS